MTSHLLTIGSWKGQWLKAKLLAKRLATTKLQLTESLQAKSLHAKSLQAKLLQVRALKKILLKKMSLATKRPILAALSFAERGVSRLCAVTLAAVLLSGCAHQLATLEKVKTEGQKSIDDAYQHLPSPPEFSQISYSDVFYVPALLEENRDKPQWFFDQVEAAYIDYTLAEIMRDIFALQAINVRYLDQIDTTSALSLVHDGSIGELLDKISFATKYSYTVMGDLVTWSKFKTAEFNIAFIAGETNYMFGSDGDSGSDKTQGGGGDSGLATMTTDTGYDDSSEYLSFSTKDLSLWQDLAKSIELLQSQDAGAQYVISQSTSTVLVKDYPDNVDAIGAFIARENAKISQMVSVDIQIIEYSSESSEIRGIDWNVVNRELALGGLVDITQGFNALGSSDLPPTYIGYQQQTGRYRGASALIKVLNKFGAVSKLRSHKIISLNNQVSRIADGGDIGYLAQSGSTSTANVGSSDNLIPGILKSGQAFYMLPSTADDKVIIQLSSTYTRGLGLRTIESGGRTIETPETSTSDLFLKFSVDDGQTLLISGSSLQEREYSDNSTAGTVLLGGEIGGTQINKETVMLITPRIIRNQ